MSGIHLRPNHLEKAPKFRIKISVPNSARTIRTSWIVIDEQQAATLQASVNDKGFVEFPIDVTVLCEYKHDIRANHQSNLEFDLEVITSGSRAKTIGSGSVDLAVAVQSPMKFPMKLRKDATTTGFIKIEVHSLCIAKTSPLTRELGLCCMGQTSDSETDFSHTGTPLTEDLIEKIKKTLANGHIVAVDGSTRRGGVLMNAAYGHDYVMSVPDVHVAQYIFDIAAENPNEYTKNLFRFVVAGDMYFLASVMTQFLAVRDKGLLPTDAFVFMFMPLVAQTDRYREEFGVHPPFCQTSVFDTTWLRIFDEQSSEQNVPAAVTEKFEYTITAPIITTNVSIMNVMVTTISDQMIIPMIIDLQIGEYIRTSQKEMKATFFTDSSKTVSMKFHHLSISRVGTQIVTAWRKMSNVNELGGSQSVEKYTSEKKSREANKVILSIKKGQAPVRIKIDNKEYRGVISITVTMRDPKIALRTAVPKP